MLRKSRIDFFGRFPSGAVTATKRRRRHSHKHIPYVLIRVRYVNAFVNDRQVMMQSLTRGFDGSGGPQIHSIDSLSGSIRFGHRVRQYSIGSLPYLVEESPSR